MNWVSKANVSWLPTLNVATIAVGSSERFVAFDQWLATAPCGYGNLLESWWTRVTANVSERVKFPSNVTAARRPRAWLEMPKVAAGTIHSVTGGQADAAYLFPDLSQAVDAQYARTGKARDSVIRLSYKGLTRVRETLCTCQQETGRAVKI